MIASHVLELIVAMAIAVVVIVLLLHFLTRRERAGSDSGRR